MNDWPFCGPQNEEKNTFKTSAAQPPGHTRQRFFLCQKFLLHN